MKCPKCGNELFLNHGRLVCSMFPIRCDYVGVTLDQNSYIVFDTETTGLSAATDEIIEIAAVYCRNDEIVAEFSKLGRPQNLVPARITQLTGISNEMLVNQPSSEQIVREFIDWLSDKDFGFAVAHNASFDISMLKSACRRAHLSFPLHHVEDTLAMAKAYFADKENRPANYKEGTLADFFDIHLDAHRALNDVKALQQIFVHIRPSVSAESD